MAWSRVLIVSDGASPHTRRLVRTLAAAGLDVWLASFENVAIDGVSVRRLGQQPPDRDLRYLAGIVPLARLIRQIRPAIIHAHYVSSYGLMAALALRFAHPIGNRPRLVQTAWGSDLLVTARSSTARRTAARLCLRAADLITGDSNDLEIAAHHLAPAVPYRRFVFGPARSLFESARNVQKTMVSSRRLDPDTRVGLVVAAFRLAKVLEPVSLDGWRLVIAGSGRDESVRRAAAGQSDIELVGHLEREDLDRLLGKAAVAVSIPVSDASSAALLESMAAGVLPLVNDLPANREWVDEAIGELVERDPDEEALARAMIRAARRTPDVAGIRARVGGVVWEDEVARLISAYQATAGSNPFKPRSQDPST